MHRTKCAHSAHLHVRIGWCLRTASGASADVIHVFAAGTTIHIQIWDPGIVVSSYNLLHYNYGKEGQDIQTGRPKFLRHMLKFTQPVLDYRNEFVRDFFVEDFVYISIEKFVQRVRE